MRAGRMLVAALALAVAWLGAPAGWAAEKDAGPAEAEAAPRHEEEEEEDDDDDEEFEPIQVARVPKWVGALVRGIVPQATIAAAARHRAEDGEEVVYRLRLTAGRKRLLAWVEVNDEGEAEGHIEERLDPKDLPKAAMALARKNLPKPRISEAEKIMSLDGKVEYRWTYGALCHVRANEGGTEIGIATERPDVEALPPAVKAAVLQHAKGARLEEMEKVLAGGKVTYRIAAEGKGTWIELVVTADGVVEELEAEMHPARAPKAVRDALERQGVDLRQLETILKRLEDGQMLYEVEHEAGGRELGLVLAEDGTVLEREDDEDDDDDDDREPDRRPENF